jgi:hypothetical protein
MFEALTRRHFLTNTAAAGALAGLGDFAFLGGLPPVSAAEAKVPPKKVQLSPEIEPLVRLIEDTERSKLLEAVAGKIKDGLNYRNLLSALLLAGVRSIKPRPVGFKFHAVLVVNSAHLASLAAPDKDRWLPLLWGLDNFKESQAQNKTQNAGWVMPPVDEAKLPTAAHAKKRFRAAMDDWDPTGTDVAVAALVRSAGSTEVIEEFWRYGARDFRDIGHKAIYVANSYRTLQTIGWRHAEPVVRSLAFALLEHSGGNPAKRDDIADRPWRENLKRAKDIRADWRQGKADPHAATELLGTLRSAPYGDCCAKIVELLNKKVDPASVWDGLFLTAGELIMREQGIVGVHCVTSINALHYAYQTSGNDETRRLMMLQGAAFLALFRKRLYGDKKLSDELRIEKMQKVEVKKKGPELIEEIFSDVGATGDKRNERRMAAARKTLALLDVPKADPQGLMTAARRLLFTKGNNAHDYKYSSAALEDYYHASTQWRARYLAATTFWLRGSGAEDNRLIKRARAALAKA